MSRFSPGYGPCISSAAWGNRQSRSFGVESRSLALKRVNRGSPQGLGHSWGKWAGQSCECFGPDLTAGWKHGCVVVHTAAAQPSTEHTPLPTSEHLHQEERRIEKGLDSSPSQKSRAQRHRKLEGPGESSAEKNKSAKQFIRHRRENI